MPIWDEYHRIAVWGCGREGVATLDFLRARGCDATMLDDSATASVPADAEILIGDDAVTALLGGRFDAVVKSPGIPLRRPEIASAQAAGVRFTSPTNLWFEANPGVRVIAVSGTKGKSTTARLTHYLLETAGYDAKLYGNVGWPAIGHAPGRDVTVLELSSYQIADLSHAPTLAVLTNLYPEHAPWHGGVEAYYRDKLRLLGFANTVGIANRADPRLCARLADQAGLIWFNTTQGFAAQGETLLFDGRPVSCRGLSLRGEHNYADLAAACTAVRHFGVDALREQVDLSGFVQLPHRLEEFSVSGIVCVNDSLSTVPEACIAALKTYAGRRTALLLGGFDRGQDYTGLLDMLPQADIACVALMPDTGVRIADMMRARRWNFDWFPVPDLDAAVTACWARLKPGDVLLMSPASPSFGRFKNYEERGERFKTLCRNLAQR